MSQRETNKPYPENWKESDHPFFQLVQEMLAGRGASFFFSHELLEPENDFWGEDPPQEIIVATGSTRKAAMLSSVLNGVDIPFAHPMDFQTFMKDSIHNGDGALKKKTFLGKFHGVPVFADSAADGETAGNNPTKEALNKAQYLASKPEYASGNVIVVSTDTVDFVDWDGNGAISPGEEGLGKPLNDPRYPQKNVLMNSSVGLIRAFGEQIFAKQRERFQKLYVAENFAPGLDLIHTNAIAILDILAGGDIQSSRVWEVMLKTTLSEDFMEKYSMVPDQGGGGASQQSHNWESHTELFDSMDPVTREELRSLWETEPEFFKFLVIFQMQGMPAISILREIERLAEKRRTAQETAKEVVVFNSEDL